MEWSKKALCGERRGRHYQQCFFHSFIFLNSITFTIVSFLHCSPRQTVCTLLKHLLHVIHDTAWQQNTVTGAVKGSLNLSPLGSYFSSFNQISMFIIPNTATAQLIMYVFNTYKAFFLQVWNLFTVAHMDKCI